MDLNKLLQQSNSAYLAINDQLQIMRTTITILAQELMSVNTKLQELQNGKEDNKKSNSKKAGK